MFWLGLLMVTFASAIALVYFAISGLGAGSTPESRRQAARIYGACAVAALFGLWLIQR
jgi:hypothetical protein